MWIQIFLVFSLEVFIIWGFANEKKLVAFERKIWKKMKEFFSK